MKNTIELDEFLEKLVYLTPPHAPVLVSTKSPYGNYNLAPFEQFMMCSDFPPRVTLAISPKSDTVKNIRKFGQFVVGIPTPEIANEVYSCGEAIPRDKSEFDLSGLTPTPSNKVDPPRILECPINFECKLHWDKKAGDHVLIVGSVIHCSINKKIWNNDKIKRRLGLDMLYYATSGYFMKKGKYFKAEKKSILDDYYRKQSK